MTQQQEPWADEHPLPDELDAYLDGLLAQQRQEQRQRTATAMTLLLDGLCMTNCGRDAAGTGLTCGAPECLAAVADDWPVSEIILLREKLACVAPLPAVAVTVLLPRWVYGAIVGTVLGIGFIAVQGLAMLRWFPWGAR